MIVFNFMVLIFSGLKRRNSMSSSSTAVKGYGSFNTRYSKLNSNPIAFGKATRADYHNKFCVGVHKIAINIFGREATKLLQAKFAEKTQTYAQDILEIFKITSPAFREFIQLPEDALEIKGPQTIQILQEIIYRSQLVKELGELGFHDVNLAKRYIDNHAGNNNILYRGLDLFMQLDLSNKGLNEEEKKRVDTHLPKIECAKDEYAQQLQRV